MPVIRAAAEDLDSESDPALMRFVELIQLCSAVSSSLELCCVDEAGSELMRGQVGRTRSAGLSPCPPVPSVFPLVFGCRTLSRASGLAGKGNARGRAGLWGLHGSGFVSAGIWVGVRERWRGCRGCDGRAEPFGDRLLEVSGVALSLSPVPGGKAAVPPSWHPGKAFTGASVRGQRGCGCLRPAEPTGVVF